MAEDFCEECGLLPANVHLTQIVENATQTFHLCEECAKKRGIHVVIETPADAPVPVQRQEEERTCAVCSRKLSEFRSSGWLGCPSCYEAFFEAIEELLLHVHGSSCHKGKRYCRTAEPGPGLPELRRELETAIKNEDFERAAFLRDTICNMTGADNA
jgi:protein arginine kinase activator